MNLFPVFHMLHICYTVPKNVLTERAGLIWEMRKWTKSHLLTQINVTCCGSSEVVLIFRFLTESLLLLFTLFFPVVQLHYRWHGPYHRVLLKPLCFWGMYVSGSVFMCILAFICLCEIGESLPRDGISSRGCPWWLIIVFDCSGKMFSETKDHCFQLSRETQGCSSVHQ